MFPTYPSDQWDFEAQGPRMRPALQSASRETYETEVVEFSKSGFKMWKMVCSNLMTPFLHHFLYMCHILCNLLCSHRISCNLGLTQKTRNLNTLSGTDVLLDVFDEGIADLHQNSVENFRIVAATPEKKKELCQTVLSSESVSNGGNGWNDME